MRNIAKIIVPFLVLVPICIGTSLFVLPEQILRLFPDEGETLVSKRDNLRRDLIFWFENIVELADFPYTGIVNRPTAESEIPMEVLIELRRKKSLPVLSLSVIPPTLSLDSELDISLREMQFVKTFLEPKDLGAVQSLENDLPLSQAFPKKRRIEIRKVRGPSAGGIPHSISDVYSTETKMPKKTSIAKLADKLWSQLPPVANLQGRRPGFSSQSELSTAAGSREITPLEGSVPPLISDLDRSNPVEVKQHLSMSETWPLKALSPDSGVSNFDAYLSFGIKKWPKRTKRKGSYPETNELSIKTLTPDRRENELISLSTSDSDRRNEAQPLVKIPEKAQRIPFHSAPGLHRETELKLASLVHPLNSRIVPSNSLALLDRLGVMDWEEYISSSLTGTDYKKDAHQLGMQYYWGNSVPKDLRKAAKWFLRAADRGDARAQYILGLMAMLGQGMRKSYAKAAKWLKMASEQNHAPAQYNLGLLYYSGQGVPKNDLLAYDWFQCAASLGNEPARTARDTLDSIFLPKKMQN